MNYEQKYKEALEKARQLCAYPTTQPFISDLQDLFPELYESEDERIKNEIIDYISTADDKELIPYESWIAWLEKQTNKKDIHLLELKAKAYDDAKERMSYAYNQNRVPIGFISEIFPNLNSYEKQSEQKPADKVESKFHEGDWVIDKQGIVHQISNVIENVTNHTYGYDIVGGGYFNDNTEGVRLWTIEDAKDGDVLACKEEILLFKSYSVQGRISLYCWYNGHTDNLHSKEVVDALFTTINMVCPATKEQRDLLFQKMKEAGYEWDADTKELINL